ncbi:peptide/nickel transport system substrate-binding protein [Caldanaerobius fijiensis DSM 17918]|uniref:Peptide/nickel transport system substrate-binding protein n=1 Tax=Caldanaerobius fijiensis DSM 17918 TaxID=1121256 RepID=A0A1M4Y7J8_9THEO|nr:ABC transporter substrate-binding protein [Caldanaerobius fijiensis]SHF01586.1 peptide/nickel transport system substrate-binding protein [Caldanaerobius fijiensis DSM 17918]
MKAKKLVGVVLAVFMILSVLVTGCRSKSTSNSSSGGKTTVKEAVFPRVGGWPKPPLFQGNVFSSAGIGTAYAFMAEGLYQYVRSTDKIYPRLAEGMPENKGNETIVHIRKDAKWNDGQPFTSKDVWAFYTLNNGAFITKYLTSIETPDDYTVVFKWADPQLNETIKTLLVGQDLQATIPYHIYKQFVDKADEILKSLPTTDDLTKRGPFTKLIDDKTNAELNKNWQNFITYKIDKPILTGPYIVDKVTASDMILKKNPYYYNKYKIHYDIVHLYQTDSTGALAMLQNGRVAQSEDNFTRDEIESMLSKNKDLVFYPMKDPAAFGFAFNLQKTPFNDVNVRRAIVYALDRKKIRDVVNWTGILTDYSALGMPQNMDNWINPDIKDKLTKYNFDPEKAAQLLEKSGWKKGSDGIWRDKNGKQYEFTIAAPSGWSQLILADQIASDQLKKFGLPTKLLTIDGTIYWQNAGWPKCMYDMSSDWMDVTWGFMIPYWAFHNFYEGGPSSFGNFPRITNQQSKDYGKINMILPGPDGQLIDIRKTIDSMLYMNEEQMKDTASKLAWITNENAFAVDYFLNTAFTTVNMKYIDKNTLPMADRIDKYNRNMPVPTDPKDAEAVANINFGFDSGIYDIATGNWRPPVGK